MEQQPDDDHDGDHEWIKLNVGGKIFTTTRTTLCNNEPDSMLARMFHYQNHSNPGLSLSPSPRDSNGAYLIDRSPEYFKPILNYLRHGKLIIDHNVNIQGVLEEAKFYGITSLLPMLELETERWFRKKHQELLQSLIYDNNSDGSNHMLLGPGSSIAFNDGTHYQTMPPLTRNDVIKALISTPARAEGLRFQGANLFGANLSRLDLRSINFKFANLRNSNLKGANLTGSNLERADMYQCNLEGAQLTGANLAYSNLENSNLRAVTIVGQEASHNSQNNQNHHLNHNQQQNHPVTSFEGANMRDTNFEGSQLPHVNMRVAILKGSNLQNCDLTGAFLAGADLENCDLSGSDLNEANLRGANVKGATFELEVL